jgi:hypothetical protein
MATETRCVECGEKFTPQGDEEFCSDPCQRKFGRAVLEEYGTVLHGHSTARRVQEMLGVSQ